jgi:hypothetical protein
VSRRDDHWPKYKAGPQSTNRSGVASPNLARRALFDRHVRVRSAGLADSPQHGSCRIPEDMRAHLNGEMPQGGWNRQYLEPLQKYLG